MTDQASTSHPTHSSSHSSSDTNHNNNHIWYAPYSNSAPSIGPAPLAYPADYYPLDNGGPQGMDPGLEQALGMMFGDGDLSAMFMDDGFTGSGVVQTAPGVYEHMG